jgi:hypothetical protein
MTSPATFRLRRAGGTSATPSPQPHAPRRRGSPLTSPWRATRMRRCPIHHSDVTGRDVRVPAERSHANGVTGVGTVTVAVSDIAPVRNWYANVLGQAGEDIRRPDVTGAGVRFRIGPHVFVRPRTGGRSRGARSSGLPTPGSVPHAARLSERRAAEDRASIPQDPRPRLPLGSCPEPSLRHEFGSRDRYTPGLRHGRRISG